jgi:methylene-tetrahydromethanopterin dehydrogenase
MAIGALAIGNVKYQTMQRIFRSMVKAERPVYYDFRTAFSFARAFVAEAG